MRLLLGLLTCIGAILLLMTSIGASGLMSFLYDIGRVATQGAALLWNKTPDLLKPLWGLAVLAHLSLTIIAVLVLQGVGHAVDSVNQRLNGH